MHLKPSVYAPFESPEEYILEWTDLIWEDYGLGRLGEHYAKDMVVHSAYGPIRSMANVLRKSLVKKSAFPNRIGTAEDVICEARGDNAFVSHHRVFHSGLQEGMWDYGAPTGRESQSRNIAICLVRDGLVEQEWVVRPARLAPRRASDDRRVHRHRLAPATPRAGRALHAPGPVPRDHQGPSANSPAQLPERPHPDARALSGRRQPALRHLSGTTSKKCYADNP